MLPPKLENQMEKWKVGFYGGYMDGSFSILEKGKVGNSDGVGKSPAQTVKGST